MVDLSKAHLQASFRVLTVIFLLAVAATLGTVLYLASVRSTVTITPTAKTVSQTLHLTIGPAGSDADIIGTVTQERKSATVTAKPSATGTPAPAKSRGTVVLHNETSGNQALSQGTRLQDSKGTIARTTERVDVPAHGTVSVEAISDIAGTDGELQPGRLTIVALRPANQQVIYGMVETAFTGGTTTQTGTLGVDGLTQASNDAEKQITDEIGSDKPGLLHVLIPDDVAVTPEADEPSDSYSVKVTVIVVTATYPSKDLETALQTGFAGTVADDESVASIGTPTITFEQQPASDQVTVTVKATAQTAIKTHSPVLQPSTMAGKARADVIQSLLGTNLIQSVDIKLQPFWRTNLPTDPTKITVQLKPAVLDATK